MSQNPPVNPDLYQPRNFTVSNITRAAQAVVTTTEEYDYVVGQLVRFHIPVSYGMSQLNEQEAYVTSLNSSNIFTTNINTLNYDSFIPSPTYPGNTSPQVSAIGDKNLTSSGITISGAFQQIA
jgi:hypothetical protein